MDFPVLGQVVSALRPTGSISKPVDPASGARGSNLEPASSILMLIGSAFRTDRIELGASELSYVASGLNPEPRALPWSQHALFLG